MPDIPGLDVDVFFGAADKPLLDWADSVDALAEEDEEDRPLTHDAKLALVGVLGFDPDELWDDEPSHNAEAAGGCGANALGGGGFQPGNSCAGGKGKAISGSNLDATIKKARKQSGCRTNSLDDFCEDFADAAHRLLQESGAPSEQLTMWSSEDPISHTFVRTEVEGKGAQFVDASGSYGNENDLLQAFTKQNNLASSTKWKTRGAYPTTHGGPGSGNFGHAGRPGQVGGSSARFSPKTPTASVRKGVGGTAEGFEIKTQSGASIMGYSHNADFPGDRSSATRGELFYAEVPKHARGKGIGKSLAKDALGLLTSHGARTVNLSVTSKEGRALVQSLLRDGDITGPIRTSETGKAEYTIGGFGGNTPSNMNDAERQLWSMATKHIPKSALSVAGVTEFHIGKPTGTEANLEGYTLDGKVWVNGSNPQTAIHEIAHRVEFGIDQRADVPAVAKKAMSAIRVALRDHPNMGAISHRERATVFLESLFSPPESRPRQWVESAFPDEVRIYNESISPNLLDSTITTHGGPGSGNFGHAGRPGQVGGSSSSGNGKADLAKVIKGKVNLSKVEDPDVAQRIHETLSELVTDYGVNLRGVDVDHTDKNIWDEGASAIMYSFTYSGKNEPLKIEHQLVLDASLWKDKETLRDKQRRVAGFVADPTAKGMLRHEMAHAIHKEHPEDNAAIAAIWQTYKKKEGQVVSEYSTYDQREMVAEAFAHYLRQGDIDESLSGLHKLKPIFDSWRKSPTTHGGPGSGNFGHAGRPGQVGGSSSGRAVVSETSFNDAEVLLSQGVRPDFKRERNVEQFGPGAGLDRKGLYVAQENAFSKGSYGSVRLHLRVDDDHLDVPAEMKHLGYKKGGTTAGENVLDYILRTENGAVTSGELPPSAFTKVEVWDNDKWQVMSPEEFLQERGVATVPRLPSVAEYETTLRENADRLFLSEAKVLRAVTDYNRAKLSDKLYLAQDLGLLPESPTTHGGPGSGNFGHRGRPGQVGGSASSGSALPPIAKELRAVFSAEEKQEYNKLSKSRYGKKVTGDELAGVKKRMAEMRKSAKERLKKGKEETDLVFKAMDAIEAASEDKKPDTAKQRGVMSTKDIMSRLDAVVDKHAAQLRETPDNETGIEVNKLRRKELHRIMKEESTLVPGIVGTHGMSHFESMRQLVVDGLPIMWSDNKTNSGATDAKSRAAQSRALSFINELAHFGGSTNMPKPLWEANKKIIFSSQKSKYDAHWQKEYNLPGFVSHATGGDGAIVVYKHSGMKMRDFFHESGHNLAFATWGSPYPPANSTYGFAQSLEKPVTLYGAKSTAEDFAEAVMLHVTPGAYTTSFPDWKNHANLIQFPHKRRVIQQMLGQPVTEVTAMDTLNVEGWTSVLNEKGDAQGCGANAPGGGGFQPGNTCAAGTQSMDVLEKAVRRTQAVIGKAPKGSAKQKAAARDAAKLQSDLAKAIDAEQQERRRVLAEQARDPAIKKVAAKANQLGQAATLRMATVLDVDGITAMADAIESLSDPAPSTTLTAKQIVADTVSESLKGLLMGEPEMMPIIVKAGLLGMAKASMILTNRLRRHRVENMAINQNLEDFLTQQAVTILKELIELAREHGMMIDGIEAPGEKEVRKMVRARLACREDVPHDDWAPVVHGGPGSGNFGHKGRPGQVGGSSSSGSALPTIAKELRAVLSAEEKQEYNKLQSTAE